LSSTLCQFPDPVRQAPGRLACSILCPGVQANAVDAHVPAEVKQAHDKLAFSVNISSSQDFAKLLRRDLDCRC